MSEQFKRALDEYVESLDDAPDLESSYEQGWDDCQQEVIKILEKYDSRDWLNFVRAL